ncbi:MAG: ABC transporter permease [Anaerolineae bacterium]|nr:ABC transporter permease [Anaerolineae bacterium]
MSNVTASLNDKQASQRRAESFGRGAPAWWLMFTRELADLWIGGKALYLILAYSLFLGFQSYAQVKTSETSFIPPKEMVFATLQGVIYMSGLIGMIIGADSISGERERGTLEALLLTPASRRQMLLGKFLAGLSPWPIALLIAIPFFLMLAQGDPIFGQALYWGSIVGTLLAIGFTGLGMLVSFWSNSNRVSFFVSLGIYIVLLLPSSWPGRTVRGTVAKVFQRLNPIEGPINEFLPKILVNNRHFSEYAHWLWTPEVFAGVIVLLLFLYAGARLSIEARQR